MPDEHCLPHQLNLAAYALGTLDLDEIPSLEAHLNTCEDCQSELADYQSVAIGLLQSVPPQPPPLGLRRKLIARLPSQSTRSSGLLAGIFGQLSLGQVVTTVVMIVLLGLNIFSVLQIRGLERQQAALAERIAHDQTAIAMLAYPSTQALPVHGDVQDLTGSMLVDRDKNTAVLVLWNLPQLEAGQTYQIWLIDSAGDRTSGGLFTPVPGQAYTTTTVYSHSPLGQFVGVGATIEPEGGSEGPTGPRVLTVEL